MTMRRYLYLLKHDEDRSFLENLERAWEVWRSGGSDWGEYISRAWNLLRFWSAYFVRQIDALADGRLRMDAVRCNLGAMFEDVRRYGTGLWEPVVDRGGVIQWFRIGRDGRMEWGRVELAKDDPRRYGR